MKFVAFIECAKTKSVPLTLCLWITFGLFVAHNN